MQVPPQFSAVKVEGERAYDIARAGEEMDLAARPLWVEKLDIVARPMPTMSIWKWSAARAAMCGPSRAIWARPWAVWAMSRGCGAHGRAVRRRDGLSMEQIDAMAHSPDLDSHIRPLELGLADLPELPATPEGAARLRNGNPGMVLASHVDYGAEAWASLDGHAIAVGRYKAGELHPSRVFNRGLMDQPGLITRSHVKGDAPSVAVYSDCERYRYLLTREWAPDQGRRCSSCSTPRPRPRCRTTPRSSAANAAPAHWASARSGCATSLPFAPPTRG